MSEPYKTTLVKILGEEYPLKSDADSDYLRELAQYVEDSILKVKSRNKLPPQLRSEVLAALIIADEYFTEKKKYAEIEEKLAKIMMEVEKNLDKELSD